MLDPAPLYQFLSQHGIAFERHDHPPVYTCEEADEHVPSLPATKTKNLFLRDKKGRRHFLVTVSPEKTVDLKALSKTLEVSGLSFGSAERLDRCLGIEPGAVSLLAALNDKEGAVSIVVDADLWENSAFLCHPLVNTSTLVIDKADLERFLNLTGHEVKNANVPSKDC